MTAGMLARTGSEALPHIPDNAPFSHEQRAWLNGYLAGLYSRAGAAPDGIQPIPALATPKADPIVVEILYGSQSGNAESLARRAAKHLKAEGCAVSVLDMVEVGPERLATTPNVLLIASTYGDGDPPDNAKSFWAGLSGAEAPCLAPIRFAVLALGDTQYERFCAFGRALDERMAALGAVRMCERVECDVEFDAPFAAWLTRVGGELRAVGPSTASPMPTTPPAAAARPTADPAPSVYSRKNPYPGRLLSVTNLNGAGSLKETFHVVIGLEAGDLPYEAGDALGILPVNCAEYVDELIGRLSVSADEPVPCNGSGMLPLRQALTHHYDVTRVTRELVGAYAERARCAKLAALAAPDANGQFTAWADGREVIDLLIEYPDSRLSAGEFLKLLRPLAPRLYSIASSPAAHRGEIHLTVGAVRYESHSRARKGVCSCFLADRVQPGDRLAVHIHANRNFRLPVDRATPIVMIGPGTGIAPFRAFLHERRAGGGGRNWLFFGNPRSATDFLYRDELEAMSKDGTLTRLDTAFSRDQADKVYVQHRIDEHAAELFRWLEDGARVYVCGDASRMAADVDRALQRAVQNASGKTSDQAAEYIQALRAAGRYQRDVY